MEIEDASIGKFGSDRDGRISTIRLLIASYEDNIKTANANLARLRVRLEELEDSKQIPLPMGPVQ